MENRAHALAAGLFTLLLAIAAGFFVWWLGQDKQDVNYYLLEARDNVTGLNAQAQVRYRGIRAGRVESIDLDPSDRQIILVRISLDARYPLTEGAEAKLNTQGVTGLAYVQLEDDGRNSRPLTAKSGGIPRLALSPTLLDKLGSQAGDVVAQLNLLALRMNRLLDDQNLTNVAKSLGSFASAMESLNTNLNNLQPVVTSLQAAFSENNIGKLSSMLTHLDKAAGDTGPLVKETRDTIRNITTLVAKVDKITSDAGTDLTNATLPRANTLVQELATSSRQLSRLIENINREPQSLVFGRGTSPPGPGEAGFVAPANNGK